MASVVKIFLGVLLPNSFQLIINVSFWRVVPDDIYITKVNQQISWLACTSNRLRIRSMECITEVPYFFLHVIVIVFLGLLMIFEKFNFFFKCAIILFPMRVWYSSWFISFCMSSFTSFFISQCKISLIFFVFNSFACIFNKV